MKEFAKKSLPDVLVIVGFLLIAFVYFFTPLSQHLVLGGHDTVAGMGQGHEQELFHQATGETSRWTGSIFSGMPTYQISPSYGPTQLLGKIGWILGLFTTGPLNYVFMYLLGFYILMRSFRLKPGLSALGSVMWAFSSYFFIIIAAGHIWKVNTLAYIPPTLAGMVLAYRGKYLWGCLVTALFTGLQVLSNHIQMTYYFLFLMFFISVAYGVEAYRTKQWRSWLKATGTIVMGGLLGAAINIPNLFHTWEYSRESMRGPSELTAASTTEGTAAASGGLDRDYITAWSYGVDETMTLMIPMFKGGGSSNIYDREDVQDLKGFADFNEHAAAIYQATQGQVGYLPGTSQYWGDQPFTVGPVYVGAIVCFLFLLGAFVVRGPMKWALLAATLLSFLFAWGKNIMPLTDFFIDHLPMYNKFRTVSSALVVAELTMPLLGILGLAEVLQQGGNLFKSKRGKIGFIFSFVCTAGICLLFAVAPNLADCISAQDMAMLEQFKQAGIPFDFCEEYRAAIIAMHEGILATSAIRSFLLIVVAGLLLVCYMMRPKNVPAAMVVTVLFLLTLADMWNINRNYLNDANFQTEGARLEGFGKTPADEAILKDKDPNFRVLNLSVGNPFNESDNHTAYWHKNIGGYHAAKLHRYQDVIDRYLNDECQRLSAAIDHSYNIIIRDSVSAMALDEKDILAAVMAEVETDSICPVLNMLNMKWIIMGQGGRLAFENKVANGNAWYVRSFSYVDNANAEIDALSRLDLKHQAVADKRFAVQLGDAYASTTPSDTGIDEVSAIGRATLTSYQPNELHYNLESEKGGVVVFSEIHYPGWTATVDGKSVELGRVNYILRALRVPAGKHEVVFTFRPVSVTVTNAIAYGALVVLLIGFVVALVLFGRRKAEDKTA